MPAAPVFLLLAALGSAAFAADVPPLFTEDFQKAPTGKVPDGFAVMSGGFVVAEDGGDKFLELPGAPLDTFGLLFGPAEKPPLSASARFFGTKSGRKFPAFGISLGGLGGYRLQVSPGKRALEVFKGDESLANVPHEWTNGAWTRLRVQLAKGNTGKWTLQGKVWPDGTPEPAAWTIQVEIAAEPAPGRPGLWGSPYSGEPIRFDDLLLTPAS